MGYNDVKNVFEHSAATGAAFWVEAALAHFAQPQGCYPSAEKVAVMARVTVRTVYRAIETLEVLGEVEVIHSGGRHPHRYLIHPNLDYTPGLNHDTKSGLNHDTKSRLTLTLTTPNPDIDDTSTLTLTTLHNEPSSERASNPARDDSTTTRPLGQGGRRERDDGYANKYPFDAWAAFKQAWPEEFPWTDDEDEHGRAALTRALDQVSIETVLIGVTEYRQAHRWSNPQFIKRPTNWIKNKGWTEHPQPKQQTGDQAVMQPPTVQAVYAPIPQEIIDFEETQPTAGAVYRKEYADALDQGMNPQQARAHAIVETFAHQPSPAGTVDQVMANAMVTPAADQTLFDQDRRDKTAAMRDLIRQGAAASVKDLVPSKAILPPTTSTTTATAPTPADIARMHQAKQNIDPAAQPGPLPVADNARNPHETNKNRPRNDEQPKPAQHTGNRRKRRQSPSQARHDDCLLGVAV